MGHDLQRVYTWEELPKTTFFSRSATASDLSVGGLFLLSPTQQLTLSPARSCEAGIKDLLWYGAVEWALSLSDIERSNVYSAQAGQILSIEGKLKSQGVEFSAAVRPTPESKIWEMSPMSLRAVTTMTSRAGRSPAMPAEHPSRCGQRRSFISLSESGLVAGRGRRFGPTCR
jgi:hypothetical protein